MECFELNCSELYKVEVNLGISPTDVKCENTVFSKNDLLPHLLRDIIRGKRYRLQTACCHFDSVRVIVAWCWMQLLECKSRSFYDF